MRVVVVGAGAIGGVIGARLYQGGVEVALVARRAHHEALASSGLTLHAAGRDETLPIPVVDDPARLEWSGDEVVVLAVKGQDTEGACDQLERVAPETVAVVCAQNGVENERRVLRRFRHTYAMCVMLPASHLTPGVVVAHSSPVTGLLDVGRYPEGQDETSRALSAVLNDCTFDSRTPERIMRWKYTKLLKNLANAVEALCGPSARTSELTVAAVAEGEAVLGAAGIDVASWDEDAARRGDRMTLDAESAELRVGGSSWQSLARGAGSIEADYLNGEIALLGRLHRVDTPVNSLLQRRAAQAVQAGEPPGTHDAGALLAEARSALRAPGATGGRRGAATPG